MKQHLLFIPVVAATLLLSTLGCSKKDDPTTTTATNAGSFKRDGVTITGTSQAYLTYFRDLNGQSVKDLFITITEATPSASDARSVTIEFQDNRLYAIKYKKGQGNGTDASTYPATSSVATAQETSPNSYSGTFSGTGLVTTAVNTQTTITDGVFTDARL